MYPVVIELLDADDDVVDRLVTHLVRLPRSRHRRRRPSPRSSSSRCTRRRAHRSPAMSTPPPSPSSTWPIDALLAHPGLALTLQPTPEALAGAVAADPTAAGRSAEVVGDRTVVLAAVGAPRPGGVATAGLRDELLRQIDAGASTVLDITGALAGQRARRHPGRAVAERRSRTPSAPGPASSCVPEADLEPLDDGDFPLTLTRPFRARGRRRHRVGPDVDAAAAAHARRHRRRRARRPPPARRPRRARSSTRRWPSGPRSSCSTTPRSRRVAAFLDALLAGLEPTRRRRRAPATRWCATAACPSRPSIWSSRPDGAAVPTPRTRSCARVLEEATTGVARRPARRPRRRSRADVGIVPIGVRRRRPAGRRGRRADPHRRRRRR